MKYDIPKYQVMFSRVVKKVIDISDEIHYDPLSSLLGFLYTGEVGWYHKIS